jgi:predicted ArsR family transcriptional regulator
MLREVLCLAVERGTARSDEVARALDTSPELVRLLLAELTRRDYLHPAVPGCSTACEHCPLRAACLYRCHARVWMLTRKGEAWLAEKPISRTFRLPA